MGKRFTSKGKNPEELNQQTAIARAHTDFNQHGGTVVCDFESSLPKSMGQPNFDLVTFSMDKTGGGVFTLVEYKCNEAACKHPKHGLKKHANDMWECVKKGSKANDWYKEELLRRLRFMHKYGLLRNCPDGLDHLCSKNVELRAAFLFTPGPLGDELRRQEDAAALCEKYIEADPGKFSYCFADSPENVDLSDMKNWKEFRGN